MPIAPGTRLGQYEVQDFIGQGAMGLVYRAYHAPLQRTGAVKVMQAIAPDPDAVARFRHEAQAIAQMRHPNILNVYDFGEHEGTPYMIVEFVAGGSLADRLSRGPLEHQLTIKYLRGIAAGLDHAHSMGIVHRDVKPANVLLTTDDSPVLADFGLAKLLQGSSLKSMSGVTTGTPAYMAPEQVTGSQVGPAADRYALATIAYEMTTGFIPFEGQALLELLYAQVHRYPDPPSARNRSLGPEVDAVIMRGLGKDPLTRWASCAEFVDALQGVLQSRSLDPNARTVVMRPPASRDLAPHTVSGPPASAPPISGPPASTPYGVATVAAAYPGPPSAPPNTDATLAAAYPGPPSAPPSPAVATPSQPAARARRRSHRGLILAVSGLVIFVLALATLLAYAITHQQPVLSLSSTTVSPGDTLVVNASKLPPNQSGEFQLYSQVSVFPFQADGNGQVTTNITIPYATQSGDHTLKICWSGTCHGQAALTVLARQPSPSPFTFPTPSTTVTASPIVTRSPSPAPPLLALSHGSVAAKGSIAIDGTHFPPQQTVVINFIQSSSSKYLTTTTINLQGSFLVSVTIPSTAVPGPAFLRACTPSGTCAYASITVNSG